MPKFTSKPGTNWLIEVTKCSADGKPIYKPDGTIEKIKIPMGDAKLPNGQPQPLYFNELHPRPGIFKGMAEILIEHGHDRTKIMVLKAECPKFKCAPPATDCCCHHILFNEPDFVEVETVLEAACLKRGFQVIFLPKFHCELNFIEQCWGYAKRIYRLNPESSKEDQLEKNALAALEAVPLEPMRSEDEFQHFLIDV